MTLDWGSLSFNLLGTLYILFVECGALSIDFIAGIQKREKMQDAPPAPGEMRYQEEVTSKKLIQGDSTGLASALG